eukprot:CAMPEP_0172318096 /NCGR_PEP_ID=MMETSP1058-20130122/33840_1 /TAXON_ID=83371 /ORGANISM="Detonula confervacea, Strain CCMP 353" /LENGTH=615 /DNA_ID=CAMNT_0013032827 /DNA_START=281 /DNA_END=2124 /DNA_ORIENTATION=+
MKVTGYYGPHRFRERNGLSYTKLTRIIYGPSGFQINERGSIWGTDVNADAQLLFGPSDWNPPANASMYCHQSSADIDPQCGYHHYEKGLIGGAHMNGVEVYTSIGGPESSEKFSEMASDPEARAKFAHNTVLLMRNYDFDGLDIAWQFPQNLEDMSNYSLLLSEVRLALYKEGNDHDKTFGLTATLPCRDNDMEHIDIRLLDSVLTEFNLLSFDFQGPWDHKVGINSPLFDPSGGEGNSVDSCVTKYTEGGAPKNKINIGLAFYGHSFRGGKYISDECTSNWAGVCADAQTWLEDGGSPQYHNIYQNMHEMSLSFDLQTMTPLASYDRGVVSFDDPRSICLKTEYAILNELNGLIIMELAADMLDDLSTPLLDAVNMKILQNINCGSEEFEQLFQWREVAQHDPYNSVTETTIIAETTINEPSFKSDLPSGPNQELTYKYVCGLGEGSARDSCNSEELDAITCEHGTCPKDMLCFVVQCAKPTEHEVQEQSVEGSFSKSKPKRKPRPTTVIHKMRPVTNPAEAGPPREEMELLVETSSAPDLSFSCGVNFGHAKLCGNPCPNGLTDCPSGQFCFWLECGVPDTEVSSSPALTTMKYQCGETRDKALTCSEECGFA